MAHKSNGFFIVFLSFIFELVSSQSLADDIRLVDSLSSLVSDKEFSVYISDCNDLTGLSYNGEFFPVAGAIRGGLFSASACEFKGLKSNILSGTSIEVDLQKVDGEVSTLSEIFNFDANDPEITLNQLAIDLSNGSQELNVELGATDDTDVSFIEVNISGYKVSEIRNLDGVVHHDSLIPFVNFTGKIYPTDNGGNVAFSIGLERELTSDEVAGDGILIVEATVVDPSGNSSSLSEFRYTGDSIDDQLTSLSVPGDGVLFTDMLDTVQIIPTGVYKYRGSVPLIGRGSGLSFTVSNPELVGVTSNGVIYPKKQESIDGIEITVTHTSGLSVIVPVELNFERSVIGIKWELEEVPNLDGLNIWHEMPALALAYDDGSQRSLPDSFPINCGIPSTAPTVLKLENMMLSSSAEISRESTANVECESERLVGAKFQLPISFSDALPEVALNTYGVVAVGDTLPLAVEVSDDVGIRKVTFLRNGELLAVRDNEPYDLNLSITESMDGQTYEFIAQAEDSAGQIVDSIPVSVRIEDDAVASYPGHIHESPSSSLPVVEGSFYWYRSAYDLGLEGNSGMLLRSDIESVTVYLDGEKIDTIRYPTVEPRMLEDPLDETKLVKHMFEVWQLKLTAPMISADEAAKSIYASYQMADGTTYIDDAYLIKVIENNTPQIDLILPEQDTQVPVNYDLMISSMILDDDLYGGTELEISINDEVVERKYIDYEDIEVKFSESEKYKLPEKYTGAFSYKMYEFNQTITIAPDTLGEELNIRIIATDSNGKKEKSGVVTVSVISDQPPGAVVTSPTSGKYITEGEQVVFSVSATDDVAMKKVEFFVNGSMLDVKDTPPYSIVYEAPLDIETEQVIEFSAIAYDSNNQSSESQTVSATLGRDDKPPVLEWVSPEITGMEGDQPIIELPENSTQVIKVSGYDNVGIDKITAYGVVKTDSGYYLTQDSEQSINLDINKVPNSLNQYSAAFLVYTPALSVGDGLGYETYQIKIIAEDKKSNQTEVNPAFRVLKNSGAKIDKVEMLNKSVYSNGTYRLSVAASDDVAVERINVDFTINGSLLFSKIYSEEDGLIPGDSIIVPIDLELDDLNLENQNYSAQIKVTVLDAEGLSDPEFGSLVKNVEISSDVDPPAGAITEPIQGSYVYLSELNSLTLRIVDNVGVASWTLKAADGSVLGGGVSSDKEVNETVNIQGFCQGSYDCSDKVELVLTTQDIFGNTATTNWEYSLVEDMPPMLSVRLPISGASYYEGEAVSISLLPSDDIALKEVGYKLYEGETLLHKEVVATGSGKSPSTIDSGIYYNASYRVVDNESESIRLIAYAIDSSSQETQQEIELDIRLDSEAPILTMVTPSELNIDARPTGTIKVDINTFDDRYIAEPVFSNNEYIQNITATIVLPNAEELDVSWKNITTNTSIETVKLPNPGTFGEIVYSEQYRRDYKGSIVLPSELSSYEGQTLILYFSIRDNGGNITV
ncbi:MAG: hypothetical protein KBT77_06540, partial [Thalassolituus oleivorans]|uniref:Ig-like domain-containing protein n=1 Tax=Thalassolituus oleivorans TaxID=187493 RepID=UPI001B408109